MAINLPSCFFIQFLEQLLKFLLNFTLLKYVKSQRNYGFLITKELIFGFQILDLKDHFSASLSLQEVEKFAGYGWNTLIQVWMTGYHGFLLEAIGLFDEDGLFSCFRPFSKLRP